MPARGVVLKYTSGDGVWCPYSQQQRSFSLEVLCANVLPSNSYTLSSVREENTCDYRLQFPSITGCPLQCLTNGGNTICNNNGVCGYNADAQRSQCFCYSGYGGNQCDSVVHSEDGIGAEGILLIIVCIILTGVIGLIVFMYLRLRRLQVDPAAYGELQGRFNELGQLA